METRTDKHQEQNEVWKERVINGGKGEGKEERATVINRYMEGKRKRKNRCKGYGESTTMRTEREERK